MPGPKTARLFEIERCGDPHDKYGRDVREYEHSYSDSTCVFRGDLSPARGRDRTVNLLRRLYPGCRVRVVR